MLAHSRFSLRFVFLVLEPVFFLVPGWLIAVDLPSREQRWSPLEEQLALGVVPNRATKRIRTYLDEIHQAEKAEHAFSMLE